MSRIEQYNSAGQALSALAEKIRTAKDEELPELQTQFNTAQAEFARCKANLDIEDGAAEARTFTPRAITDPAMLGMSNGEVQKYSLVRALRAQMLAREGDPSAWKEAGLEREASQAVAAALGREARGVFVPTDVQTQKRALRSEEHTSELQSQR